MRAWALAALLMLGCDDPEVSDKALSVLEHGIIAAQAECYTDESSWERTEQVNNQIVQTVYDVPGNAWVQMTLFQDGTRFSHAFGYPGALTGAADLELSHSQGSFRFWPRSVPSSDREYVPTSSGFRVFSEFSGGDWRLSIDGVEGPQADPFTNRQAFSGAISEYCTGFGLEKL